MKLFRLASEIFRLERYILSQF